LASQTIEEEEITEDDEREWEECMDRRRMMFAMRQSGVFEPGSSGIGCPEFEGYRSISKSLVDMLRSVGCGDVTPPIQEEDEGEEELTEGGVRSEGLFERLRNVDRDESGLNTPSLISSAGSEVECCTFGSPQVVVVHSEADESGSKMFQREVRLEVEEE